jgi:hypothetical protein
VVMLILVFLLLLFLHRLGHQLLKGHVVAFIFRVAFGLENRH